MAPSTLIAYGQMRGEVHKPQPLHQALFTGPNRATDGPFPLPLTGADVVLNAFVADPDFMPSSPAIPSKEVPVNSRNRTLWWDPLAPIAGVPPPRSPTTSFPSLSTKQTHETYAEYKEKNPPILKSNHYRGREVYSNFGYVRLGGEWADPDSNRDLHEASEGIPAEFRHDLPGEITFGPRILNENNLDDFYDWYVAEVSDEIDDEGDPRDFRITPEIFTKWAVGVSKSGDVYCEDEVEPQVRYIILASPQED